MKIRSVEIKNFRGIQRVALSDLGDVVVLAGPNGCGKSCVLDAIRLLKSVYGGYQPNEVDHWFNEFQIVRGRATDWRPMFHDKDKTLSISATFSLAPKEIAYLRDHGEELLRDAVWEQVAPEAATRHHRAVSTQARVHEPEVFSRANELSRALNEQLKSSTHSASWILSPDGTSENSNSLVLELIFRTYDPDNLGIIDFQGASRNFGREGVGGINLNIEEDESLQHHALYNYTNKFANLKTHMASAYIKGLLAKQYEGNSEPATKDTMTETLQELFQTFFPGKVFPGPTPSANGTLTFPVVTASGATHDINELSSGEKEVLYGYLRLRNAAPSNSILMIDEPELHLNPRLVSGLAHFYKKHLGEALGNQLWLVTHSDTLMREAVGSEAFSVYHMQGATLNPLDNQASIVNAKKDIERLVIDLVGDLAAYRPGAKIVLFEGGGDQEFDVRMVSRLFPAFEASVNLISAGDKRRVRDLYDLLASLEGKELVPAKFFAIIDRDWAQSSLPATAYQWDVFHIENYLLHDEYIRLVLIDLNILNESSSAELISERLRSCAKECMSGLVRHALSEQANRKMVASINTRINPNSLNIASSLKTALDQSAARIKQALESDLTLEQLQAREVTLAAEYSQQLANEEWRSNHRGRDILKRFADQFTNGLGYERFRDLILARMRADNYQPLGMKIVVDKILAA